MTVECRYWSVRNTRINTLVKCVQSAIVSSNFNPCGNPTWQPVVTLLSYLPAVIYYPRRRGDKSRNPWRKQWRLQNVNTFVKVVNLRLNAWSGDPRSQLLCHIRINRRCYLINPVIGTRSIVRLSAISSEIKFRVSTKRTEPFRMCVNEIRRVKIHFFVDNSEQPVSVVQDNYSNIYMWTYFISSCAVSNLETFFLTKAIQLQFQNFPYTLSLCTYNTFSDIFVHISIGYLTPIINNSKNSCFIAFRLVSSPPLTSVHQTALSRWWGTSALIGQTTASIRVIHIQAPFKIFSYLRCILLVDKVQCSGLIIPPYKWDQLFSVSGGMLSISV